MAMKSYMVYGIYRYKWPQIATPKHTKAKCNVSTVSHHFCWNVNNICDFHVAEVVSLCDILILVLWIGWGTLGMQHSHQRQIHCWVIYIINNRVILLHWLYVFPWFVCLPWSCYHFFVPLAIFTCDNRSLEHVLFSVCLSLRISIIHGVCWGSGKVTALPVYENIWKLEHHFRNEKVNVKWLLFFLKVHHSTYDWQAKLVTVVCTNLLLHNSSKTGITTQQVTQTWQLLEWWISLS